MHENHIHFCVASGNQYYQLTSFFEHPETMSFIAENGGYIISENKEIFNSAISKKNINRLLDMIENREGIFMLLLCGKKSAYIKEDVPDDFYERILHHFPKLIKTNNFRDIDDTIMKVSLGCNDECIDAIRDDLATIMNNEMRMVSSGHRNIDIIQKEVHKGTSLKKLCDLKNIDLSEVMAFGDAMNDLEMLQEVGYGFAMINGKEELKQAIGRITHNDNLHDGEFEIMEEYFANPEQFLLKYKKRMKP